MERGGRGDRRRRRVGLGAVRLAGDIAALPALVQSITTLAITLIGYSAMAGAVGGGGLGQMAINYGYNRWQDDVMISTVVAIIVIVQIIQLIGDILSRLVDHRAR